MPGNDGKERVRNWTQRHGRLKDIPQVQEWHSRIARRSLLSADVRLRSLGMYCEIMKTGPLMILESTKNGTLKNEFRQFVDHMEREGKGDRQYYYQDMALIVKNMEELEAEERRKKEKEEQAEEARKQERKNMIEKILQDELCGGRKKTEMQLLAAMGDNDVTVDEMTEVLEHGLYMVENNRLKMRL